MLYTFEYKLFLCIFDTGFSYYTDDYAKFLDTYRPDAIELSRDEFELLYSLCRSGK